ncbi:unnamed protein product [Alopecurus aequalis]
MANPTYFRSAPLSKHVESRELNFHLYMRQPTEEAPEAHENGGVSSGQPKALGASGCAIYDGLGSDANLVARAQGVRSLSDVNLQAQASLITVSIEFVDERFKGSTLTMVGNCRTLNGEWAVVGGTGEFGFAQGVATWEAREELEAGASTRELRIHCVTLTFPKIIKDGMFGGPGGFDHDTPTVPQRLESVTIQSDEVLTSIAFSYIDDDGQLQKAGPWGFDGANSNTIQFAPTETTYGPFGRVGDAAFSSTTNDTHEIVGIFLRCGHYVDAIGVHVRSK